MVQKSDLEESLKAFIADWRRILTPILKGFGQIMLQESAFTGALFMVGIAVHSIEMLVGAILGSLVSMAGAFAFRYARSDILRGYYGFNGALVGIAIVFNFSLSLVSITLIAGGALLSTVLMQAFLKREKQPALTAPFVCAAWVMLFIAYLFSFPVVGQDAVAHRLGEIGVIARGVGQVMFQENWLTGFLFVIGLAGSSRQAALWCVIGSTLGTIVARAFELPEPAIASGLFGFNAALVGIALSARHPGDDFWTLLGVVLSVLLTWGFLTLGVPPLTAPFVFSTWAIMFTSGWSSSS